MNKFTYLNRDFFRLTQAVQITEDVLYHYVFNTLCYFQFHISRSACPNWTITKYNGRGGSAVVHISCSGCSHQIEFTSLSMSTNESRCNVVSYAVRLAAFVSGIGFAGYHKLFGHHLGMRITTDKMFLRVIEEAFPHITNMLDEVCELGKEVWRRSSMLH